MDDEKPFDSFASSSILSFTAGADFRDPGNVGSSPTGHPIGPKTGPQPPRPAQIGP